MEVTVSIDDDHQKNCRLYHTNAVWSRGLKTFKYSHDLSVPVEYMHTMSPSKLQAEYVSAVVKHMDKVMTKGEQAQLWQELWKVTHSWTEETQATKVTVKIKGTNQTIDLTGAGIDISSVSVGKEELTASDWAEITKQAKIAVGDKKWAWKNNSEWSGVWASNVEDDYAELGEESHSLPGVHSKAAFPCSHREREDTEIREIIIHLNDTDRWPREKIADWLDDLQDNYGYDFTFQVSHDEPLEGGKDESN